MRVGFVFHHIGPYHHARINAVASNYFAAGIEWSAYDNFGWGDCATPARYEKIGLFDSASFGEHRNDTLANRLRRQLEATPCDVIFVNGWGDFGSAITLKTCLQQRIPCVLMSESTQWDGKRTLFKEWVKRRVVDSFSAALVGGSPHAEYLNHLGFSKNRICLGYDAVDNHYFRTQAAEIRAKADMIRLAHGLPDRFFLASARFIEKKNLGALLTAFSQYRKKHELEQRGTATESWHLVLLGDGELRTDLERLRTQLGLDRTVHMPGFKQYEDLPAYYGTANAFVHASTTEQWGLVVNEAMASGLPVLVSNRCGCARDLVRHDVNGFTFDPYNIAEFSELMYRVATSPDATRQKFGESSREMIAAWGPDRFASGVKHCTEIAMSVGSRSVSGLTRLVIQMLCKVQ